MNFSCREQRPGALEGQREVTEHFKRQSERSLGARKVTACRE